MRVVVVGLVAACGGGAPKPTGEIIVPDAEAVSLALDNSTLYWAQFGGGIFALPVNPLAATPTTLVARDADGSAAADNPTSLAIANGMVYWTDVNHLSQRGGGLWVVPESGGAPVVIAAGLDQPRQLAIAGSQAYFLDGSELLVTSLDAVEYPQLVSNDVDEFHIANDRVYWTSYSDRRKLYALDLSTPAATPMLSATIAGSWTFAVDDVNLYLRTGDISSQFTITKQPLAGGDPVTVFDDRIDDGVAYPALVVVGGDLYSNSRSAIVRVSIDGRDVAQPVANESGIETLVVGNDAIYFSSERNDLPTPQGPCACPVIAKAPI